MNEPQAMELPGNRLHLHHGPIDLIVGGEGAGLEEAYRKAAKRFQSILSELVSELDGLRMQAGAATFNGTTARRMDTACSLFIDEGFVTPMAAVAGAVADEILAATLDETADLAKLFVNNGGDIAFHLTPGTAVQAITSEGHITIEYDDAARGIATSGWRGRSMSLGIADAVTILADCAATADVAATMIANAIDLPGHPAIIREPASTREVAHELGDRLVTKEVGPLNEEETAQALDGGAEVAQRALDRGVILGAQLALNGQSRILQ